jgi:hypothetical protein
MKASLPHVYTTRLLKAGAAIEDTRILLRYWTDTVPKEELTHRLVAENALGKTSRMRVKDVVTRIFIPRYVDGDPKEAWRYLKILELGGMDGSSMSALLLFHTARCERLLYDFVVEELFPRFMVGRDEISVDDTARFISDALVKRDAENWTETVKIKVARGMLAALRDFGILQGKAKKKIRAPYLSPEAFAFIAFLVHLHTKSGERIVNSEDWRLYLLTPEAVERKFLEAHRLGYLSYRQAGNLRRIEFPYRTVEDMAHAIIESKT